MLRYGGLTVALVLTLAAIMTITTGNERIRNLPLLNGYQHEADATQKHLSAVPALSETDPVQVVARSTGLRPLERPLFDSATTFTMTLHPGWNAVYLSIQPEVNDAARLFEGTPVRSVWTWNQQSPMSAVSSATDLEPGQTDWLAYFPPADESASFTNLFVLNGGRAYLIELDSTEPVEWAVTGQPVLPPVDWIANSFNLVGFSVDPATSPTFESFFASSVAHAGQAVYRLATSGQWQEIANLGTERIQANEAYLVFSEGASHYSGPVGVTLEQGGMLDFGKVLDEQTLLIRNESVEKKPITITHEVNEPYLVYWKEDDASGEWVNFPGNFSVQAGKELALRVAVRRDKIAESAATRHHSTLEISDNQGTRLLLPVAIESLSTAGLWVGTATLNKVSEPAGSSALTTTKSTGSEFQMRLIVHVDGAGQARLLQQVTLMWKEGTERPDPQDPTKKIVNSPGKFILVTRDELLSQFTGAAVRAGQPVGRRISSAAFSFQEPVGFTGEFGSRLQAAPITIDYDDPLNPFKHKYHPNHDNLDYDFATVRPEGTESFTIIRAIELEFTPKDPEDLNHAGWVSDQVGGIYREAIRGVHKDALHVEGTFRLQLVSTIDILNDGR